MNFFARFAGPALFAGIALSLALSSGQAQDDVKKNTDPKPEVKKEAPGNDKLVFRIVTPEKLEGILTALKIDFTKEKGKTAGIDFYDYTKGDYRIRLHNYQGKDLWVDAQFSDKLTLDDVNKWNVRAKFSRAVMLKGDKEIVSLESQLDCLGGVTDSIIRQFIERFDGELAQFKKYVTK